MILIGVGSNLGSARHGSAMQTCEAALDALEADDLTVRSRSRWYRTAPVPPSDQPWFVNGVVSVATSLAPAALLARLHALEAAFGRRRRIRNEARALDLDLLAYHDLILDGPDGPVLPHPRLHQRAFVLLPLREVAANWRHPRSRQDIDDLVAALPVEQVAEPVDP